ncbi:hypothetical protein SI65_05235 [Aspergillus cristatus]|uniref:Uncharacterized protein n=1 Tax=Aspergillus cristatus TaxID=573508 RepID=A0A1E3BCK3_ASPCR|nr:hypothetical protein SI65_05235 [Aspergillus cristatus]
MGNINSAEDRTELDGPIITKLQELEDLLHRAGDMEAAGSLKAILSARESVGDIRDILILEARRRTARVENSRDWFKTRFRSREGILLSDAHVDHLAEITQAWELSDDNSRTFANDVRTWAANPAEFWGTTATCASFVERCLLDKQAADKMKFSPVHRRVILVLLAELVEEEIQRTREGSKTGNSAKLRSQAAWNIITREYPNLSDEELEKKKEKFTRAAWYGKSWLRIQNTEAILALPSTNAKKLEKRRLEDIEIEAINAYESTLKLGDRVELKCAYEAIRNEYKARNRDTATATEPPQSPQAPRGRKRNQGFSSIEPKRCRDVTQPSPDKPQPPRFFPALPQMSSRSSTESSTSTLTGELEPESNDVFNSDGSTQTALPSSQDDVKVHQGILDIFSQIPLAIPFLPREDLSLYS